MKKSSFLLFLISLFSVGQHQPTPENLVMEALETKTQRTAQSLVKNIPLKNIGPSVMSGRVIAIAVNPENTTEFYVGYASGGLWHTTNNGTTFTPVLDQTATQNIGAVAVHWSSGTMYVGTGENNSSRSSYAGIGILKSSDKGKTWKNIGLTDSHHIGRIIINPKNPDEVIIGVTGHLYSTNTERGIFKTVDGGKTWQKTLYINDETGIIDVAFAPENFNIQFATAWEKDRKAWNFKGSGANSSIYKSTDAGSTWVKVTTIDSGFPTGTGVGRIGLAVFDENTILAVHDNQFRRPKEKGKRKESAELVKDDFKTMSSEAFLKISNKKLNSYLKRNNFEEEYHADTLKQLVRSGTVKPIDLAKYVENANALLFDTPVIGAEVYKSTNGGKTWLKQNENYIDDLYYSYGYYFAQIAVDPNNINKVYLAGVPIIKSEDGGKTYASINGPNVHADHHAIWVDPNKAGHIINGNDGGVNISYDDGDNWIKNNAPNVGQFYAINVNHEQPYHVYGGLQDNGVWKGPHNAEENKAWHQSGQYPWKEIIGGDGMQIQIDNRNSHIVYTGYQFGNYYRLDLFNNTRTYIQPKHKLGETPYRFNWQTPILLSPHNQDILYLGGNKLHRSFNQGDTWESISDDLTQGAKKGNVAYGTLTTISESPFKFGHIYTGSDDGIVQLTQNGGATWTKISDSFPKDLWVSRVVASKHKKERVYVALNGYRWDDFNAYLYASDDYGATWKSLSATMPNSPINVVIEDTENKDILYVGTDNGLYVSFNKGTTWEVFQNGIPNVAVHDLVIQPKAKHLLVGTHGRSIYKADISKLQQMTPTIMEEKLYVFDLDTLTYNKNWGNTINSWRKPNTPGIDITFYSSETDTCTAIITSADGIEVSATEIVADKGLNILSYDVAFSKAGKLNYLKKHKADLPVANNGKTYLPKGTYTVELSRNKTKTAKKFTIE